MPPVLPMTLQLGVEEDGVVEVASVCMQESTTRDTETSLVRPQPLRLGELLDSWGVNSHYEDMENCVLRCIGAFDSHQSTY